MGEPGMPGEKGGIGLPGLPVSEKKKNNNNNFSVWMIKVWKENWGDCSVQMHMNLLF